MACLGRTKPLGDVFMPEFPCAKCWHWCCLTSQSCKENKSTQFERCPDAISTREVFLEPLPAQESFHGMWGCHAWHRDGTGLREARNTWGLWAAASIIWAHFSCTVRSCGYRCDCLRVPLTCVTHFQQWFCVSMNLYLLGFCIFV